MTGGSRDRLSLWSPEPDLAKGHIPFFPPFAWGHPARQTVSVGRAVDRDKRPREVPMASFFCRDCGAIQ